MNGLIRCVIIVSFIFHGLIGCGIKDAANAANKAVDSLDYAITQIETQSNSWQKVLQDTSEQLMKDGQTMLANEVKDVLSSAINYTGVEIRCNVDFLKNRAIDDLKRIKAKFTNTSFQLLPVLCKPNPLTIDMTLSDERRNEIELIGYNLETPNAPDTPTFKVYLIENHQTVDVTKHLAGIGQYIKTLNLGGNGVPLSNQSNKIEFRSVNNMFLGDINIIQPPVKSKKLATISFSKLYVKNASEGRCGSYTGEYVIDINVNGQEKKIGEIQVRDGHNYPLDQIFFVELMEEDELRIYVNGTEIDDEGASLICSTDGNDPLGNFTNIYGKDNNWGNGVHHEAPAGGHYYSISYNIEIKTL